MKRACALALVLAGCLVPAGASAKGGAIFDRYPDVQSVGSPMKFTMMLFERKGVRPLITFRNATTGEVVRVRGSRSDLNGIAYGTVRLPSKGPWDTLITVGGRPFLPGDAEPFRVGVGLTQTIPAANAERPATEPADSSKAWLWLTSIGAVGSALLVLVMRRRRRWGAA